MNIKKASLQQLALIISKEDCRLVDKELAYMELKRRYEEVLS